MMEQYKAQRWDQLVQVYHLHREEARLSPAHRNNPTKFNLNLVGTYTSIVRLGGINDALRTIGWVDTKIGASRPLDDKLALYDLGDDDGLHDSTYSGVWCKHNRSRFTWSRNGKPQRIHKNQQRKKNFSTHFAWLRKFVRRISSANTQAVGTRLAAGRINL